MMVSYLPSGEIQQVASRGQPIAHGCLGLELPMFAEMPDPDQNYICEGIMTPRPALTIPDLAVLAGQEWVMADVPAGTAVWVEGALMGVQGTGGLTIIFPYAATWRVELTPPFPWQPASLVVIAS